MKLAIITSEWGAPWSEGVRNLARCLREFLTSQGHEVEVVHPQLAAGETGTPRSRSSWWYARSGASFLRQARVTLAERRYDAALWFTSLSSWYGAKQRLLHSAGVPIVPYFTGLRAFVSGYRWLSQPAPALVITPYMQERYLPEAVFVPPYLPLTVKRPTGFERRIPNQKFNIFFLGSFEQERGLDYLLQAFAGLDNRYELTVAWNGVGAHREQHILQSINSLGIAPRVRLLRGIDVTTEYQRADVLVIPRCRPTRMAFPVRILEAAHMRLPLVVSDILGMGAIVGDAGRAVPPATPQALAAAVSELVEDRSAYQAAVAGTERLEQRCLPLESLKRTQEVLEHVAA